MSEHDEQVSVIDYLQKAYPSVLVFSIPNGAHLAGSIGQRAAAMNKLKSEGLLPGVSDLEIFEPRGGYSCMFLEMKKKGGGNGASDNQLWFIRQVSERGAFGVVANGFDEARPLIDDYLCGRILRSKYD
jgi:hypothetical protein